MLGLREFRLRTGKANRAQVVAQRRVGPGEPLGPSAKAARSWPIPTTWAPCPANNNAVLIICRFTTLTLAEPPCRGNAADARPGRGEFRLFAFLPASISPSRGATAAAHHPGRGRAGSAWSKRVDPPRQAVLEQPAGKDGERAVAQAEQQGRPDRSKRLAPATTRPQQIHHGRRAVATTVSIGRGDQPFTRSAK